MANKEQLEILKYGVEEWNRWRKEEFQGRVDLNRADLRDAKLRSADLSDADLSGAQLRGTNLSGADLSIADLRDADLRGANLTGADLSYTDLIGANLSDANLTGSFLGYGTVSARLEESLGLAGIHHIGPSSISSEALEWAQGKLPDAFLKGIGFKDWEILNAKLHDPNLRADEVIDITYKVADLRTNSPIQTNSIFLSYSSEDQDFVQAIEKRFDAEGIRSWRDVHDLTGGPIEPQLDKAITLNGTVFLVLSKHSVNSDWVEWEVKRARRRQKERQAESGGRSDVLFPVALDDAWKNCHWPGWLMDQIMEYKVVDCSGWREEDFQETYEKKIRKPLGIYYRNEKETE